MYSENFQPLQSQWPHLYEHASVAERYVFADPATAIVKLRCFVETLVGTLYRDLRLSSEPNTSLFERLQSDVFLSIVPAAILGKLHAIRMLGNKAAHGGEVDTQAAQALLKEAYLIGEWLYRSHGGGADDYPAFALPESRLEATPAAPAARAEATAELAKLEARERMETGDAHQAPDDATLNSFRQAAASAAADIDLELETTRRLIRLQDAFAGERLTGGQTELVERLDAFLKGSDHSVFLLKGYAGTGKTFITKGLTEYFRAIRRNYVLAAPTGKASKVIARKTKSPAYTVHKTIYSYKDLVEYLDDDVEGTETYKVYAQLAVNAMSADTVFIVDEASMFSDIHQEEEFFRAGSGHLLRDFFKYVNLDHNDHRKKVIFIGDDAQLPPVGMPFSPALDAAYLHREYGVKATSHELTEVVRQKADSGVMRNALRMRTSVKDKVFNQLVIEFDRPDVRRVEHGNLIDAYLGSCGGRINGESIVIAHSNADVLAYNRRIREHFFPGSEQVVAGDKVMATSNSSAYGFFISNGDFGLVREVIGESEYRCVRLKRKCPDTGEVETIEVTLRFRDVVVGFRDLDDRVYFFKAKIVENLLYSEHPGLSSDENKALYLDFCIRHPSLRRGSLEFKNALLADPYFNALRVKFGYAITCHKAQGSEWNHVFVKCQTHQSQLSADYFRWLYTAITRTAATLHLLDPPNLALGSGMRSVAAPGASMLLKPNRERPITTAAGQADARVQSTAGAATPQEQWFDIPSEEPFLRSLLTKVRELLAGARVDIDRIDHNQYQEAYYFRRDDALARINIGFSSRARVSSLQLTTPNALGSEVLALLASLKDTPIVVPGPSNAACEQFNFDKPFLNEFHGRVKTLAHAKGILVQHVAPLPWCQRYSFVRGDEIAVYDVWYNGKSRFTTCQPLITACSAGSLVGDVGKLLTEGLSQ